MARRPLYNSETKPKMREGIPRLGCQKADVDLCTRLLEKEITHRRTEQHLAKALVELDKYRVYFQNLLSAVKSMLDPYSVAINLFGFQLSKIPEVKAKYFARTPKVLSVWVFIQEDNWEVEENIYEAYEELLDFFPDTEIDLRLLKLFGRNPEELLPIGFKPW